MSSYLCGMAFIRVDKKGDGEYLRIVETKREGNRVVQQTLYSLGRSSDYTPAMLRRMGEKLYALGGGDPRELLSGGLREEGRYNYGYVQLIRRLLTTYGLDKLLGRAQERHHVQFDLSNAVALMLVERLHEPSSKHRNYHNQGEYLGLKPVELQHVYRSLNYLAEESERIQKRIWEKNRHLFNASLDIVFYDVTTFYFDSEVETEGALRQKGFGKDGKIGKTQVVFGLLIDKEKNPVGYRVYKGNTWEGQTIRDAISSLRKDYALDKVVVVADRGMLSQENRAWIEQENGYEFILGERLRKLPSAVQDHLLNLDNYSKTWKEDEKDEKATVRYCALEVDGRTVIGTYSKKRADKDRHEREEKLLKAQKLLQKPDNIERKARQYFLHKDGKALWSLDENKIKQSEQFDGFLAITTSSATLTPEQTLEHYRNLFTIEHTFRSFKTHLETRPMFHWTDKRIEGHICLCYMAYAFLNHCLLKINRKGHKYSENDLRRGLDKMQLSLVVEGKREFYLRARHETAAADIAERLGLTIPPNLTPKNMIVNYL